MYDVCNKSREGRRAWIYVALLVTITLDHWRAVFKFMAEELLLCHAGGISQEKWAG